MKSNSSTVNGLSQPITVKDFIAWQQSKTGRTLTDDETDMINEVMPIINEAGSCTEERYLQIMQGMKELAEQLSEAGRNFITTMLAWLVAVHDATHDTQQDKEKRA